MEQKMQNIYFSDSLPFPSDGVFTLTSLCITGDRLKGLHSDNEFVKVQTFEAQLPDIDCSTGNKSDKPPSHEKKSTQKELL